MRAERARAWVHARRAALVASATRARVASAAIAEWHWRMRAELLLAAAMIGGWLLITYAVAAIVRPRIVWPMSMGLILLSASGWKLLGEIASKGCYVLNVRAKRADSRGA